MQKLSRNELERIEYIPKTLEPGLLYVAEDFGAAVHLCACGCGFKVNTPLSPMGGRLAESAGGATLTPSIGNWQPPYRSHYVIRAGRIVWAGNDRPSRSRRAGVPRNAADSGITPREHGCEPAC